MLKKDDFMDAMRDLDQDLLMDAERARRTSGKRNWAAGVIGIAAAAVLLLAGSVILIRQNLIRQTPVSSGTDLSESDVSDTSEHSTADLQESVQSLSETEGTSLPEETETERTSLPEETETVHSEKVVDKPKPVSLYEGSAICDSGIVSITGSGPEFAEGVALKKTCLYPGPSVWIHETGLISQGESVSVIRTATVLTYNTPEPYEGWTTSESKWYFVTVGSEGAIGYVKAEDIGNAAECTEERESPIETEPESTEENQAESSGQPADGDAAMQETENAYEDLSEWEKAFAEWERKYLFKDRVIFDSGIVSVTGRDSEFTEGVALKETYLYPAPNELFYETGLIYQGRPVTVIRTADVRTGDSPETEEFETASESKWYFVTTGTQGRIGYVKAEDIGNAAEVHVEMTGPWIVKEGYEYYETVGLRNPRYAEDTNVNVRGPFWIVYKNEETGLCKLASRQDYIIYLYDTDALEPYMEIGYPRTLRAG